MRCTLHRRGVCSSAVERAPAGADALDAGDMRETAILMEAVAGDLGAFPFPPE
jgi:hypothetical protein